ncbi:hypothetical protein HMPREF0602_0797 [Neisseria meningitidis ATCC 13091]|uniref:Uncharacterized protein n=1 Tax=Neisseria meningitidis serogroup B (strain ATCC 13091 / M2091) TaxID=862513 RepID=E0N8G7_NEIM3|nr:hypothetical protein HMPREF0602_0797 [Neisseria meningitidis ATCC 13091]
MSILKPGTLINTILKHSQYFLAHFMHQISLTNYSCKDHRQI